jgi:hypothetical protein
MTRRAGGANLDDRLPRRIPHSDVLDVPTHQQLPPALLPLDDETGVLLF